MWEYTIYSSSTSAEAQLEDEQEQQKVELEELESDSEEDEDGVASLIFGCTEETYDECILKKLFGFSDTLLPLVQLIKPGMPVFLFNFQTRKMSGLFEAESEGVMNIDPYAWTSHFNISGAQTNYPAQVRVKLVSARIIKLEERIFGEAIGKNYFMPGRFYFHLDRQQTDSLIQKFNSSLNSKCLNLSTCSGQHQVVCETKDAVHLWRGCPSLKPQTVVSDFYVMPETRPDFRHAHEDLLQESSDLLCPSE